MPGTSKKRRDLYALAALATALGFEIWDYPCEI